MGAENCATASDQGHRRQRTDLALTVGSPLGPPGHTIPAVQPSPLPLDERHYRHYNDATRVELDPVGLKNSARVSGQRCLAVFSGRA